MYLGRSSDAVGTYEVWVPSINRKVRSSSLSVDEEFYPWLGEKAHQPLVSATATSRFLSDHLGSNLDEGDDSTPDDFVKSSDINETPRPSLSFFNMFSGPYAREGGLSNTMKAFGWDRIMNFDNHAKFGGGWADDILNDARYTELLQQARAGAWDSIMGAFPCNTTTVARCFDASGGGGEYGPPPVRSADHPDGLPPDQLSPAHAKELMNANRMLDRMVEVMIAAYNSPRRTTLIVENPSDRSIPGTAQHMADVSHGSLWATSQFKRLQAAIPKSSMATFANCRLDGDSQKYITLWYQSSCLPTLCWGLPSLPDPNLTRSWANRMVLWLASASLGLVSLYQSRLST